MESFVFFNIAIFTTITWYTFDDIQYNRSKELLQRATTYVSVGMVALSCFLVLCFHVYRYGNKTLYLLGQSTKLCKKLKHQISQDWIQEPRTTEDRESDVYQLFDISYSYQDKSDGYSPPPAHPHGKPTSSSIIISLADCEEL